MSHPSHLDTKREDKDTSAAYMKGDQALVRLAIQRRLSDQAAGFASGEYIPTYQGFQIGRYNMELSVADQLLRQYNIPSRLGLNEELMATEIWRSRYEVSLLQAKFKGAFGIWYGKVSDIDRSSHALDPAKLGGMPLHSVATIVDDEHSEVVNGRQFTGSALQCCWHTGVVSVQYVETARFRTHRLRDFAVFQDNEENVSQEVLLIGQCVSELQARSVSRALVERPSTGRATSSPMLLGDFIQ